MQTKSLNVRPKNARMMGTSIVGVPLNEIRFPVYPDARAGLRPDELRRLELREIERRAMAAIVRRPKLS